MRHTPWTLRAIVYACAVLAAVCTGFLAPDWVRGTVRLVAEYDAAALVFLCALFLFVLRDDESKTRTRASMDDPGRNVVLAITILSVAVGMTGAIAILGKGPDVHTAVERDTAVALAIAAAVLGWCVTHTLFALRYAHLFYEADGTPDDGLVFPNTKFPDDYDFLYFSFVIGMTFQVSDVQITDPGIRRFVLLHGLISFVYNTTILALGVNLISNILH